MPHDLSAPQGSVAKGIAYAHTVAMMPSHKESAFKHLPTYTAGILFHLGIFLSLLLYIWTVVSAFTGLGTPRLCAYVGAAFLCVSAVCGLFMLGKRLFKKTLHVLSTPDDYISNVLVTLFQIVSLGWLLQAAVGLEHTQGLVNALYYIECALLFLWIPVGKIRHLLYYFFARTHLGYFYGRRGSWPPKKTSL